MFVVYFRLADQYETHSKTALENPDDHLGNPVNAFLFVKHFTIDWDRDIEELLSNSSITGRLSDLILQILHCSIQIIYAQHARFAEPFQTPCIRLN